MQQCDGKAYRCGQQAANALQQNREPSCRVPARTEIATAATWFRMLCEWRRHQWMDGRPRVGVSLPSILNGLRQPRTQRFEPKQAFGRRFEPPQNGGNRPQLTKDPPSENTPPQRGDDNPSIMPQRLTGTLPDKRRMQTNQATERECRVCVMK
jgi:hypothetical protein